MSSSKKSNSKPAKEVRQYVTGDPVLGKMRGYPPWPGIVVDPADAPPAVQQQQPPNKKANAYCILFFPMGDYGWLNPKELSFLQRHEIEAFLADDAKKRNGELREGYRIALDPQPWLNARIAAEAAQQDAEDNAQVDQLAPSDEEEEEGAGAGAMTPEGEEEEEGKPKKSRKRKRESEVSGKKEKAPAKAKAKKGSAEPKGAKKTEKKPRKSAGGAKSKTLVESEDEGAGGAGAEEPLTAAPITAKGGASPPPTKKARRDAKGDDEEGKVPEDPESLKVRDWRHKLQKTFLSYKTPPKPEAMAEFDALFTTVEQYDQITIEQLQFSKIGKVMRHIAALQGEKIPPRDADFSFRARAKGLVDKWQRILNANRPAGAAGSPEEAKEDVAAKGPKKVEEKLNGNAKVEVKTVEDGVAGVDLNGKGADSPVPTTAASIPAAAPPVVAADIKPTSTTADADGEHDHDANAEAEDASMHVEDVVMAEA